MSKLRISLLGRFQVSYDGQVIGGCDAAKVQELFCYLLLNRDRPHAREMLASLLWGDHCTTSQSKKYLRKALWQLQAVLGALPGVAESGLLVVESDWVRLHSVDALWLDVAAFEEAYAPARGVPGRNLDDGAARTLEAALPLYRGELLEGWYLDWCLCERERLQHQYLAMLDKLMSYCEALHAYEAGLSYGQCILRYDRARERTHQQMMRLYYLALDRTEALRQYERCVAALREELNVGPARSTVALYEQIRTDRLDGSTPVPVPVPPAPSAVGEVLGRLRQLQSSLAALQQQVTQAVHTAEGALERRHP